MSAGAFTMPTTQALIRLKLCRRFVGARKAARSALLRCSLLLPMFRTILQNGRLYRVTRPGVDAAVGP
jgi:hypothetical protein